MFPLSAIIWISSVTIVSSEFVCPEMTSHCTCGMNTDWWDNEWTELTFVNCSFRGLKHIPDLSSLRNKPFHRLLLNNNNITAINEKTFENLNVTDVVLRKNPIKKIASNAFVGLRDNLQRLDIDSAKIKLDDGLTFLKGLHELKILDLGYNLLTNKFKVFPSGLFENLNLSSLSVLTLQALQMSKLEEGTFNGIEDLEQLDLSHNFLPEFPKELLKLKNLKGLKLYSNEIMLLKNNTFSGLTKLKKLLVGVNDMDLIEPEAFRDLEDSIEEINLYHNPLSHVPTEAIASLRNLKKLSLVKTNLNMIENGSFVGDYELTELHLDDNPKLTFEDEGIFHGLEDSLEVLFLRTLNLTKLPLHLLKRLKSLYSLDATDNKIVKLDKHFFSGLKHLTDVRLMWNSIKHIDHRAFKKFPKGVSLNLQQNHIRDISFILEVEECTFKEIDLTQNKIKCDCTVEKVLNSGLVSWEVIGYCFVEDDDPNAGKKWYNFNDPALMVYLGKMCTKTKPYASCNRSMTSASRSNIHTQTLNIFIDVLAVLTTLLVSYVSRISMLF